MFVSDLFRKNQPRKFSFTPYYYEKKEELEDEAQERSRIKFKRYRRPTTTSQKSIRIKIIFAILLIIFLYYFRGLIEADKQNFKIEDIRIEETPSID